MKLDYSILWIDDYSTDPDEDSIRTFMEDLGFDLEIIKKGDGKKIESIIAGKEFNLIILDLGLPVIKGSDLIKKVRAAEVYTEIVFYSQSGEAAVRKSLGIQEDGVFCCGRSDVAETIKSVINLTIRKTQDLNNMRGLVIAESIRLEYEIVELITDYLGVHGKMVREKILEEIFFDFKKKTDFLNSIMKNELVLLNEKIKHVSKKTLMQQKINDLSRVKEVFSKFDLEIIQTRNTLAHSQKVLVGKSYVLKGRSEKGIQITYDTNWCKTIRRTLRKHASNLSEIATLL